MTAAATNFKQKIGANNVTFMLGSAENLALPTHSQDLVLARRSGLSGTDNWESVLNEVCRVLKPVVDSRLIFTIEKRALDQDRKLFCDFKSVGFQSVQQLEFLEKAGTPINVFICGY